MARQSPSARICLLALALLGLAACQKPVTTPAPPKVVRETPVPQADSHVTIPVSAALSDLEAALNREIPLILHKSDSIEKACVPAASVTICLKHASPCKGDACKNIPCKIGKKNLKVTPTLSCRIIATLTRGPIRLSGAGDELHLSMPVQGEAKVQDVGHVLSETATASAELRARAKLGMTANWTPTAKVELDYRWQQKPGVDLLGMRLNFAGKADPKLRQLLDRLEQQLPLELQKLQPQTHIQSVWQQAFTTVEVNADKPPVWLRITPRNLGYGGYDIQRRQLVVRLELDAQVETFVGHAPAPPSPTPLPPSHVINSPSGFRLVAPVIADYAQLEPILSKALTKLAAKPFEVPSLGAFKADFGPPTIYATQQNRLAIGLPVAVERQSDGARTKGHVWLTGEPYNTPNSAEVKVRDLQITGETDRIAGNMLLGVVDSPIVKGHIEAALAQDFSGDLQKLQLKIDKALTHKRIGDFMLNVKIRDIAYGQVAPLGQGAYLPVAMHGDADLHWSPAPASGGDGQRATNAKAMPLPPK